MKDIEKQICEDILRRQQLGLKKYGFTVANNPLTLEQWLQHAYEETLDTAVYLKRSIEQIKEEQCRQTLSIQNMLSTAEQDQIKSQISGSVKTFTDLNSLDT